MSKRVTRPKKVGISSVSDSGSVHTLYFWFCISQIKNLFFFFPRNFFLFTSIFKQWIDVKKKEKKNDGKIKNCFVSGPAKSRAETASARVISTRHYHRWRRNFRRPYGNRARCLPDNGRTRSKVVGKVAFLRRRQKGRTVARHLPRSSTWCDPGTVYVCNSKTARIHRAGDMVRSFGSGGTSLRGWKRTRGQPTATAAARVRL